MTEAPAPSPQTTGQRPVRFVAFPAETVDTIDCPETGEPMPAQIVARLSPTRVFVACPHCDWIGGTRRWHEFTLEAS